jgi:hypothetical protein
MLLLAGKLYASSPSASHILSCPTRRVCGQGHALPASSIRGTHTACFSHGHHGGLLPHARMSVVYHPLAPYNQPPTGTPLLSTTDASSSCTTPPATIMRCPLHASRPHLPPHTLGKRKVHPWPCNPASSTTPPHRPPALALPLRNCPPPPLALAACSCRHPRPPRCSK